MGTMVNNKATPKRCVVGRKVNVFTRSPSAPLEIRLGVSTPAAPSAMAPESTLFLPRRIGV